MLPAQPLTLFFFTFFLSFVNDIKTATCNKDTNSSSPAFSLSINMPVRQMLSRCLNGSGRSRLDVIRLSSTCVGLLPYPLKTCCSVANLCICVYMYLHATGMYAMRTCL